MKMNYLFKALGIKMKTVGPYNHKSLQTEQSIKFLSSILPGHLTGQGQNSTNFDHWQHLPIELFTLQI